MKRRTKAHIDMDCVVTLSASDEKAILFRRVEHGVVMEGAWDASQIKNNTKSPGATIAVLQPARVVCRTCEFPDADDDKLEMALHLQAETHQMGSVPEWRTARALLKFRADDGGRTGVIVDWPSNDVGPSLSRDLPPDGEPLFAGDSAILAAVMDGYAAGPLVSVTADRTAFSFALRTPNGLSVRSTRIDPSQWPDAATVAVVESALRGGMNSTQAEALVQLLDEAIQSAGDGGFGCTQIDRDSLSNHVTGLDDVDAWREHGLKALAALIWFSHAQPLVSLRAQPLGERPGHIGEWINRLGEPDSLARALVIFALMLVLAPPLFAGGRLLLLNWKIGDIESKERALRSYEKQMALYSDLNRRAWPMGKLLGDLSSVTPEGVEWEDLTLSQDRNVSIRGLAKTQDGQSGIEMILILEKQLRESRVFDNVTKKWDSPDAKGLVKFTLNASVVKPTLRPIFKEAQDFGRKSLSERRYGPTPPAVVTAPPVASAPAADTNVNAAKTQAHSKLPSEDSVAVPTEIPSIDPLSEDSAHNGAPTTAMGSTNADDHSIDTAKPSNKRSLRGANTTSNELAKRSERTPDSANVATPIPEPLSDSALNAMTKEEAQAAISAVAIARNSAEIDDLTKARLKEDFDKLKIYLKGKK